MLFALFLSAQLPPPLHLRVTLRRVQYCLRLRVGHISLHLLQYICARGNDVSLDIGECLSIWLVLVRLY